MSMLVRNVEVQGKADRSVLISEGVIREVGPVDVVGRSARPDRLIEGAGGVLLPGFHDHQIHLFALAAPHTSLWCGPPQVTGADSLIDALRTASRARRDRDWLIGIGWDDTVIGWPDRHDLDHAVADRPIRLQHHSGALWVLNSAALARLDLDLEATIPEGFERDAEGDLTGRLYDADDWLAGRLGGGLPDLERVGRMLASRGVTGITDASAHNGPTELREMARQHRDGRVRQHITAMTAPGVGVARDEIATGPVKIVLMERALPDLDALVVQIMAAHDARRAIAIAAPGRAAVSLAVHALSRAGPRRVDRIDDVAVAPPELIRPLARLGVTVVTQHHFLTQFGDRYHRTVNHADRQWLYRGRAFLDAAIPLAGGSAAPVGRPDPLGAISAAITRSSPDGRVLSPEESLEPEEALALWTATPERPGGPARHIRVGAVADLCLLDRPWAAARLNLDQQMVRATIIGGDLAHDRESS